MLSKEWKIYTIRERKGGGFIFRKGLRDWELKIADLVMQDLEKLAKERLPFNSRYIIDT